MGGHRPGRGGPVRPGLGGEGAGDGGVQPRRLLLQPRVHLCVAGQEGQGVHHPEGVQGQYFQDIL